MSQKAHIVLTPDQIRNLDGIERETDRPRARIIRRAIDEYIHRFRKSNPDFAARHPLTPSIDNTDRDFKPGVKTDVVVMGGKKIEVVVNPDGSWRRPVEEDYVPFGETGQMSIIDETSGK